MKAYKRVLIIFLSTLILSLSVFPAFADMSDYESSVGDLGYHVIDMACVLTDEEKETLEGRMEEYRENFSMDLVIVTVTSTDGKTMEAFADDFYDYEGYGEGLGIDRDGALLLLNLGDDRGVWQSTRGGAITVFTDYGRELIFDYIVPLLADGDYYDAFSLYIDYCVEYAECAENGSPVDVGSEEDEELTLSEKLVVSILIGTFISYITVSVMKGKLRSVRPKSGAADYCLRDTLNLTTSTDRYLYSHVSKTRKAESSSGGSSVHTSSSGATHGGGGRSF